MGSISAGVSTISNVLLDSSLAHNITFVNESTQMNSFARNREDIMLAVEAGNNF